jgi:phage tail-like protein
MTSPAEELLYNLLPAIYRSRDVAQGEPLRALLAIIEREFQEIRRDIEGLYDDLFIETCQERLVPHIGQLLGLRALGDEESTFLSRRAEVANAIGYRRRKGTPPVLSYVVQDVTGWPARRVEFFDLLATTQHLQHPRPGKGGTVDLREGPRLERLNTAFDTLPRTADLRVPAGTAFDTSWRTSPAQGKHNIPNVGLFLWRLQSYPVSDRVACQVQPGCYTFNPLGIDTQLFNQPSPERDVAEVARESHVPLALGRHQLREDLEALRQAQVNGVHYASEYFADYPVLQIIIDQSSVGPSAVDVLDLGQWRRPESSREYVRSRDGSTVEVPIMVAIDPVLGRLTFPQGVTPGRVHVSYSNGFSADIGGGPYERSETLAVSGPDTWRGFVRQGISDEVSGNDLVPWFNSIQQAVAAWVLSGQNGIIRIVDDSTYQLGDAPLEIPIEARRCLVIEAADGSYPCLVGDIDAVSYGSGTSLTLNGLLLDGVVALSGNVELTVVHCTLRPGMTDGLESYQGLRPSIGVRDEGHPGMRVWIGHSIVGPLQLPSGIAGIRVTDSIVDGGPGYAISGAPLSDAKAQFGPATVLERSTVFGPVAVHALEAARDSIFTGQVTVQRQQLGFLRYCYIPEGSVTPQRYNCQPDSARRSVADSAQRLQITSRIQPSFTSTFYGEVGYAQLSAGCPDEVKAGAEDGSEMGAFHHLRQPQRVARLAAALDEYLRHGLEVGVFYVS